MKKNISLKLKNFVEKKEILFNYTPLMSIGGKLKIANTVVKPKEHWHIKDEFNGAF